MAVVGPLGYRSHSKLFWPFESFVPDDSATPATAMSLIHKYHLLHNFGTECLGNF